MRNRRSRFLLVIIMVVALGTTLISGCSEPEEPEEPMPEPVVVAPPPPEPEPEPEPEPVFMLPLTGEIVDEWDIRLHQKPVSVKIENTPASRPALGITRADVVYETITEGGITRFNAIFHSDVPESVGSVRSARNSDVTIVPQYDALFVFSGTNSLVWQDIVGTIHFLIAEGSAGRSLYRVSHKVGPHNLYYNTALGYERFEELGHPLGTPWPKGLYFGEQDLSGLSDRDRAIEIFVPYSGSLFDVTWIYEPEIGAYLRYIRGEAQCDESNSANQIAADNVILLSAAYVPAPDVPGKGQTYNINLNGIGDAIVFMNGMRIDATWETDGTHPPILRDLGGEIIMLKPGKTWFQVPRDIFASVVMTGIPEYDDPSLAVSEETDEEAMQDAINEDIDDEPI